MSESANAVPNAIATRQDHSPAAHSDKPKRMQVRGKLAAALDRIVELGEPYNDAARNVGLTTRAIRKALEKPHVIAHLRARRQVFRAAICAANDFHLARVRSGDNAMAVVQAAKALDQLEADPQAVATKAQSPGLVIQIVSSAPTQVNVPLTDYPAKPLISNDDGRGE